MLRLAGHGLPATGRGPGDLNGNPLVDIRGGSQGGSAGFTSSCVPEIAPTVPYVLLSEMIVSEK